VSDTRRDERFFASTRGKIALLLRGSPSTVEQLAQALDLTDNAVRAHLVALERDGLVRQAGSVRTARRPSATYELAGDAERLFPKAYGAVLSAFLSVFDRELPPEMVERTLREVGRQLAQALSANGHVRVPRADAATAAEALENLGGSVSLEKSGDEVHIHGRSCPLAIVVGIHPEVCTLVEAMLEEVTGARVERQCEPAAEPHCHFSLPAEPS
jgi:predicted ArsR family transcriptional regulator